MDLQSVSFSGKTGIITGGAQGIGKAIARQFVDMGGKAVIVDINPETAARTCGERCVLYGGPGGPGGGRAGV